ncbi:MAG: MerR family transcriptional regulator [Acidimicrobiales bacterium]|nr:MerR family transcriptional regulator [Acidimicrobiales bacterium]
MPMARPSRRGGSTDQEAGGYRGPQVCVIVGITYRQLDYWARTGLLHPSITQARGSGSQRIYSYSDLVQLKVIKRLLDGGVSLQAARRAIDCLHSSGEDLAAANLVIDDRRSVLAHTGEEIIDLLKGGQTVLNIVPLAGVVTELDAAITGLGLRRPDPSVGSKGELPADSADSAGEAAPSSPGGGLMGETATGAV